MRFREDEPGELERARKAVAEWRTSRPDGTASDLIADLGGRFDPEYGPVLRAVLFTVDRRKARIVTGIVPAQRGTAQ